MRLFFLLFSILLSTQMMSAKSGHKITINIDNYEGEKCVLGYYYANNKYIEDTVKAESKGKFVFEGENKLKSGTYIVIFPPDNTYFDLLVNEEEQHFSVSISYPNFIESIKVKGSKDNEMFYDYMQFLFNQRTDAENMDKELKAMPDSPSKELLAKKRDAIDDNVFQKQSELVKVDPKYMTPKVIGASIEIAVPDFRTEDGKPDQQARYLYYKKRYFDNIDLSDGRMLRTPVLFNKLDTYVKRMTPQHPDSISFSIDNILGQMNDTTELFKYYLIHYLSAYAKSKIVGMDAVYVHLVEKYYKKGKAYWTDEELLKNIIDNSDKLKPLLLGKTAPNILMQKEDGTPIALHDVEADYTVLMFWAPDCGHCKKSAPHMVEFYKEFKDKGVKIFSVCSKLTKKVPGCWKFVKEKGYSDFINVVDPYHRSRFKSLYDIKTTPQVYILDKNKEIISKRIGAKQLKDVMTKLMKVR